MPGDNRATRTVLTVFIGSPGDLQVEREAAHKVIDGLNSHLARNLEVFVELRGWEDTLPGFSRPQDKINEDVRRSDLFVGLVWRRWGTLTGEYSSGFEEEYAVAKEQRSKEELEDIWLFFKEVPEEMLRDPGDQLRKVQEFKEDVTSRREVLYDTFQSTEEWSTKLFNYLSDYLTKDLNKEEPSQVGMTPTTDTVLAERISENSIEQSMAAVLATVTEGTPEEVSVLQVARAQIASSSVFYLKRRDSQLIGAHENNLLYASRTEVQLTRVEQVYVIRNLAADSNSLIAGWFWFNETPKWISDVLVAISKADELENVRLGALQLVEHVNSDLELERIESLFDDQNKLVAASAVRLYGQRAPSAFNKLDELTRHESEEIAATAWRAALGILVRYDVQRAVNWALDETLSHKPSYIDVLAPLWSYADTDVIKGLLKAGGAVVKRKAFEIVRGSLDEDEVKNVLADPDVRLKSAAYMELVHRGVEIDERDVETNLKEAEDGDSDLASSKSGNGNFVPTYGRRDVFLEMYKQLTDGDFESMVDWLSPTAPVKYEALAGSYFERFGDVVRADLAQDFSRIREPVYAMLRQADNEPVESGTERLRSLENFVVSGFRSSALSVLSKHAEPSDVEFARSLLRNQRHFYDRRGTIPALQILQQYGTSKDNELLKQYVANWDPIVKGCAARSLLKMTQQDNGIENAGYLLDIDDAEIVRISLEWLLSIEDAPYTDKVKELLYKDNDQIRVCALGYLVQIMTRDELKLLLDEYPNAQRYYYYSVQCWLDRVLYAPPGLREEYVRQIKAKVTELLDI